jgi:acetyl-CoA carboxylase biotin carboxyl carrier protein
MDIRKIKKLIELLEESGVSEIEIKEGEESVRIARNGPVEVQTSPGKAVAHTPAASVTPAPTSPSQRSASARASAEAPPAAPQTGEGEHMVTAPMVGTYYSAPSPGGEAVRGDRR